MGPSAPSTAPNTARCAVRLRVRRRIMSRMRAAPPERHSHQNARICTSPQPADAAWWMSAMLRARRCRPGSTSVAALRVSSWLAVSASTCASSRVRASAPAGSANNSASAASAATTSPRALIGRRTMSLSAERRDRRLVRERRGVLLREALAVLLPAAKVSGPLPGRRERRRDVLERRPVPVRAAARRAARRARCPWRGRATRRG